MNNQSSPDRKKIINGEVHNWYKITLGFSDQLVSTIINKFKLKSGDWVIDPFCGSGTTLVECKKQGINIVGIDANPSSYFASKVKTNWDLDGSHLILSLPELEERYSSILGNIYTLEQDITFKYLTDSGMIKRGWISQKPLQKALAIKLAIKGLNIPSKYKDIMLLALLDEVVNDASNIKFGPQPYCSTRKDDVDVIDGYKARIGIIADDLAIINNYRGSTTLVFEGDSRNIKSLIDGQYSFSSVICSPPYPGEHDYTRHARLELAFLEEVLDRKTLQTVKHRMIRSNTKGVYKSDNDSEFVSDNKKINQIVKEIQYRAESKSHGFAKLYHVVVLEYFGGMKRHLINLFDHLESGAQCAYVLGDQSSYLQVHIPTAEILSNIVSEIGYEVLEVIPWSTAWATKTSKKVNENILIFKKM